MAVEKVNLMVALISLGDPRARETNVRQHRGLSVTSKRGDQSLELANCNSS